MGYRFFFGLAVIAILANAGFGDIESIRFKSPSLEGNPLGNSSTRVTSVYLPPSYDEGGEFPVIYMLHGALGTHRNYIQNPGWIGDFPPGGIEGVLDRLITNGEMEPVIVVMPNGDSIYGGSWYTNSILNGNYEDYIVTDLVDFIDSNYRTVSERNGRTIAGYSMGGYGAFKLAMKHPDVYCAAASSAGPINFDVVIDVSSSVADNPDGYKGPNAGGVDTTMFYQMCAAFSPNLENPPWYVDLFIDHASVSLIDEVWQRVLQEDVYTLIPEYEERLRSLELLYFDAGTSDEYSNNLAADSVHKRLDQMGIPHEYRTFSGGHFSHEFTRIEVYFPLLANAMDSTSSTPNWEIY